MKYKKGAREFYSENSLNADFTEIFCGRSADFSALNGRAVVIPSVFRKEKQSAFSFYQTNTSQYCQLHAICTEGERGNRAL